MKTLSQFYTAASQKMFTTEIVKSENSEAYFFVYRNKGYAGKSQVYGSILQVSHKSFDGVRSFKTKSQVVSFINSVK